MKIATIAIAIMTLMLAPAFAQQSPPEMLRADLALPGQEVIVQQVELPPGGTIPWHIHPDGHEIGTVLAGRPTLELAGQPARDYGPGETWLILRGQAHGGRNAGTEVVRVLVTRITAKGKPLAVPVAR